MANYKWFIPGNVPSSKNSRRWTGKQFIASKAVMSYRQKSGHYYGLYGPQFKAQYDLETGPREIGFKFFRNSRHKFDYLNPAQTVQDEMVKYGWLEDDNMLCIIPVFFEYEYDKLNPGVEINLMEK